MLKGTGLLYRHLKTSNEPLWRKLRLSSKHSKALLDDEGGEIEVSLGTCTCTVVPRSHTDSDVGGLLCPTALVLQGEEDGEEGGEKDYCDRVCVFYCINQRQTLVIALRLHSALSTQDLECTQHSVHSKSCALECTQH